MTIPDQFDVVWQQDALGLRFTPNDNDLPVVCQVPPTACPAVLESRVAVGDVLVAFDLQLDEGLQSVTAFDQLVTVLRRAKLPVTLRFQSREKEIPARVADVAHNYVFTWTPKMPLGVSLAMDPCTLHAAITAIDPNRISPAFQNLKPVLGDVLVAISSINDDDTIRLDEMRFEEIIQTLREFPRPCQLTFARLIDESSPDSGSEDEGVSFPLKPLTAPISSSSEKSDEVTSILKPPFLRRPLQIRPKSRSRAGLPPPRKQIPISKRQSFRIDKPVSTPPTSSDSRPHAKSTSSIDNRPHSGSTSSNNGRSHAGSNAEDQGFYTVQYSGGAGGLQLRDCTKDDKGLMKSTDKSNRTNGYNVAIRNVTDTESAPGLENATTGDLLMAIGQKDLQHLSFEQVRNELGAIQSPTTLLFKKRKRVTGKSAGSSLVDSLLLFLV